MSFCIPFFHKYELRYSTAHFDHYSCARCGREKVRMVNW